MPVPVAHRNAIIMGAFLLAFGRRAPECSHVLRRDVNLHNSRNVANALAAAIAASIVAAQRRHATLDDRADGCVVHAVHHNKGLIAAQA